MRDDLGRLVGARVRARDDALRVDLQRGQRAGRGARGAAPCGHERTLGIGRAERAILGLRMSDEDDCHGASIDRGARSAHGHRFTSGPSRRCDALAAILPR